MKLKKTLKNSYLKNSHLKEKRKTKLFDRLAGDRNDGRKQQQQRMVGNEDSAIPGTCRLGFGWKGGT